MHYESFGSWALSGPARGSLDCSHRPLIGLRVWGSGEGEEIGTGAVPGFQSYGGSDRVVVDLLFLTFSTHPKARICTNLLGHPTGGWGSGPLDPLLIVALDRKRDKSGMGRERERSGREEKPRNIVMLVQLVVCRVE